MTFRHPRSPRARARRGFTLIELMVVMVLLTVSMSMFSSTLVSTLRQQPLKRQIASAAEAERRVLETLRAVPYSELLLQFDADPANDPGGAGTAPGPGFDVSGLDPAAGDADGLAGEIAVPLVAGELREDADLPLFGLPRDLNGDSLVDDRDHTLDHVILPVRVRVRWRSALGDQELDMYCMFASP